ncbi:hypothetical protein ABPG74_018386 [Tetrahymena malaccensis]
MKLKKLVLKQDQNNVKSIQQLKDTACKQLVETLAVTFNLEDCLEDFKSLKENSTYNYINSTNDQDQNIIKDIQLCSNLVSVSLLFSQYSIQLLQKNWLKQFLEAFNKCKKLTKIAISILSQFVSYSSVRSLGNLLSIQDSLQDIYIDFQNLNLKNEHLKGITAGLMKLKHIKIITLDLSHNFISNEGAFLLGKSISKCLSLRKLTIYLEYNHLTENGIESILEGVFQCNNLDHLDMDIGSNKEITLSTLKSFKSGLINLINLKYLSFVYDSNMVNNNTIENMCTNLTELKHLLHIKIDLDNNYIFYEGLKHLLDQLYGCKNLRTIYLLLRNNSFEFQKSITKQTNRLLKLKKLVLFHLDY